MQKSKFYQKVGKLTFSVVLTGILVTGVVIAATNFTNGEVLDADVLNAEFNLKLSKSDFPECSDGESLTFKAGAFSCFSQAASITPEGVQAGMVYNNTNASKTINVSFSKPFSGIPQITVSAAGMFMRNDTRGEEFNLGVSYSNVTKTGFKIYLDGQDSKHTDFRVKSASWFAIPPTGSWSSGVKNSSYSGNCGPSASTSTAVSGSCITGATHYYYTGKVSCRYTAGRDGEGFPMEVLGYKNTTQYKQTCN